MNRTVRSSVGWILLCLLLAIPLSSCSRQNSNADARKAEEAVERFYNAYCKQKWEDAADAMHPEGLAAFHAMCTHVFETTDNPRELQQLLREYGNVGTISAFKKLDSKTVLIHLFQMMWQLLSRDFRTILENSNIKIVGSVREGDLYHVVCRTFGQAGNIKFNVVSVATAKLDKDTDSWKLLTNGELDAMMQKMQ